MQPTDPKTHLLFRIPTPLPLLKPLLRLQRPIQNQTLRQQTQHSRQRAQATHRQPDNLQSVGIALLQIPLIGTHRHRLDDLHQARRVFRIRVRLRRQGWELQQFGFDLVLEDGAADGDADGLAEGPEEAEHGDGEGEVAVRGRGLDGLRHAGEEHAEADAADEVEEDPGDGGGVYVEEV